MYYLVQRGEPLIITRLARWMGVRPSTVTQVVRLLEHKGALQRNMQGNVSLTSTGMQQAIASVRRHRIIERFLFDVVRVPWHLAHQEAVGIEQAVSARLEERIIALVGPARCSPYGHPIDPDPATDRRTGQALLHVPLGAQFVVRRIDEEAEEQADLLHALFTAQLLPEQQVVIAATPPHCRVKLPNTLQVNTVTLAMAKAVWGDVLMP
ncbi:MAG: metal-dependent transcriptional regulator [Chloroflexaceae bacterium]|nr:metal-dependent transcriptional regulator [Chloroflexaceae bacterium]